MVTDAELIFWIVFGAVSLITFGILWHLAKKDAENYVDWIADGDWK